MIRELNSDLREVYADERERKVILAIPLKILNLTTTTKETIDVFTTTENNTSTTVAKTFDNMATYTDIYSFVQSDSTVSFNSSDLEVWSRLNKIRYFPFMASVHIMGKFVCGGSIIKSDLVITAASCLQLAYNNKFFRENPQFLSVRVGSTYYLSGEEISVLEVYFHPNYVPKLLHHNLAIMRLVRHMMFGKHRSVKKIKFDEEPHDLPSDLSPITIVGWGATTASNIVRNAWSNQLSSVQLEYYPYEDCQAHYGKQFVTCEHFCLGFLSRGEGACNRDAGGPAISNGVLMGVISFGANRCGTPNSPTVVTKLGYYYDWITNIMSQREVPTAGAQTTLVTRRERTFNPYVALWNKQKDFERNSVKKMTMNSNLERKANNIFNDMSSAIRDFVNEKQSDVNSNMLRSKNANSLIQDGTDPLYSNPKDFDFVYEPLPRFTYVVSPKYVINSVHKNKNQRDCSKTSKPTMKYDFAPKYAARILENTYESIPGIEKYENSYKELIIKDETPVKSIQSRFKVYNEKMQHVPLKFDIPEHKLTKPQINESPVEINFFKMFASTEFNLYGLNQFTQSYDKNDVKFHNELRNLMMITKQPEFAIEATEKDFTNFFIAPVNSPDNDAIFPSAYVNPPNKLNDPLSYSENGNENRAFSNPEQGFEFTFTVSSPSEPSNLDILRNLYESKDPMKEIQKSLSLSNADPEITTETDYDLELFILPERRRKNQVNTNNRRRPQKRKNNRRNTARRRRNKRK